MAATLTEVLIFWMEMLFTIISLIIMKMEGPPHNYEFHYKYNFLK